MNLIGVTTLGHSFPCESVRNLFSDVTVGYVQKIWSGDKTDEYAVVAAHMHYFSFQLLPVLWHFDAVLHCLLYQLLAT